MSNSSKKKPVNNNKVNNNKKKPVVVKKERGIWLTTALVIMAVHGLFAAYAVLSLNSAPDVQRPWIIGMTVFHFLANIVAAGAIFYWKKWGLYLYFASTIVGIVAGTLAVGLWSIYYLIIPLVILGYIIRSKREYFV